MKSEPYLILNRPFQSSLFRILLLGIVLLSSSISAQENIDEVERRLENLRRNPVFRELMERGKKPALTEAQKKILADAVRGMDDAAITRQLQQMGLSTEGSIHRRRERLETALGILPPPELPDQKPPPAVAIENASEGEYLRGAEDKRGLLKLRGRIRIRLKKGVILADLVIVDPKRKELYAEGNLQYRTADALIRAERMIFSQELGTGIMYNANGYQKPVYFIGRNLTMIRPGKFGVSHAFFSSCAAELPHYNFTARKIWIYEGRRIVAVGVVYYVGGVPVLPLPFLFASEWGTGVILQAGYGQLQGFFLQSTYQFSDPQAAQSSWMPMYYRFTLDGYQNTGEAVGAEFSKFSPQVNYLIQGGAARFKEYGIIGDYREKDALRVTNQVPDDYGFIGRQDHDWYKIFAIMNARKFEAQKNHVRNVYLRLEDYSHMMYEFEFGARYQPTSTIPALYENSEAGRGLIRPTTNWNLIYSERWDTLSVRLEATRNRVWLVRPDSTRDRPVSSWKDFYYTPANDTIPSLDLNKNFYLGRLPLADAPVYWDHTLHVDLQKRYSEGSVYQTLNNNLYRTDLHSFFSWYPYITFRPLLGGGAQKTVVRERDEIDDTLAREAARNSYQFFITEDEFTFGPDFLFMRALHIYKQSFKEELKDAPEVRIKAVGQERIQGCPLDCPVEEDQKINETLVALETHPLANLSFSVESIYDHRKFQYPVGYRERWYYPTARLDYLIDFLNFGRPERENLLNRRKLHFIQLRITDDYVYDFVRQRDHSNVLGLNFQTGGFDLWLLRRLRYLELGYYWYHVYYNQKLDHMRFTFKTDIQLTRNFFLEMELESRAVNIERYSRDSTDAEGKSDYVAFEHDIINSSGIAGPEKRQKSVFNVGYFECALIMDLHEWEMRLGYSLEQKSILTGVGSVDIVHFYDNKVFFSLTMLRFDVGGTADRPSRFLIHRRQVRSTDLGRSSIRAVRN